MTTVMVVAFKLALATLVTLLLGQLLSPDYITL